MLHSVESSPFSLEVLRVAAEVHQQLPVTRTLHFYLQQATRVGKQSHFSDSHAGVGLYPLQEVEFRKHGGCHQLHGSLIIPLGFLVGERQ